MVTKICQMTDIGRETINKTIAEYKETGTVSSPNKKFSRTSLIDQIDDLDRNGLGL